MSPSGWLSNPRLVGYSEFGLGRLLQFGSAGFASIGALLRGRIIVLLALGGALVARLGASSEISCRADLHGRARAFAAGRTSVASAGEVVHSALGSGLGGATSTFGRACSTRVDTTLNFLSS